LEYLEKRGIMKLKKYQKRELLKHIKDYCLKGVLFTGIILSGVVSILVIVLPAIWIKENPEHPLILWLSLMYPFFLLLIAWLVNGGCGVLSKIRQYHRCNKKEIEEELADVRKNVVVHLF
jgi:hypothetical protein